MKNLLLTIAFFLALTAVMAHDNERFMQVMSETLSEMGKAKASASMQDVANKFERIANTETNEWLPILLCRIDIHPNGDGTKRGSEYRSIPRQS